MRTIKIILFVLMIITGTLWQIAEHYDPITITREQRMVELNAMAETMLREMEAK